MSSMTLRSANKHLPAIRASHRGSSGKPSNGAAVATESLSKERQRSPVRRRGRTAQAQQDRQEEQQQQQQDEDEDDESPGEDDEEREGQVDGLSAAEQQQVAAEEDEGDELQQPPLPSSASLLWSLVSFLLPLLSVVLRTVVVAVLLTAVAVSLAIAFLPWHSVLASTQTVLSSLASLLSVLLPLSSASFSSPGAVSSHVQQHLPTVIHDLSSAHPRFSSALHSTFLPALQHHFALQYPSRPLVLFVAESAAVSQQEETRAVITELAHALYPAAVPALLLDLSAQLRQPRFTGRQLRAALQAFFSRREDGLVLLPSLLSLPAPQLSDIASTLQLLCDDSLAPYRRAVFVISAELDEKRSPQQVRAAVRELLLQAAEQADLVDAMLSRLLRNIVVVR